MMRAFSRVPVWVLPLVAMAVCVGVGCAVFLWCLDAVTGVFFENPWLLLALPAAGAGTAWV